MMHGHEKSDLAIVAGKPANKAEQPAPERSAAKLNAAEPVERRAGAKGNAGQQSTCRAQNRVSVSQALGRIRKVARERKKERFTMLFHHLSIGLLEEAFFELKEVTCPRDFGALITSETGSRFGGSNAQSAFHGRADGRDHPRGGS